MSRRVTAFRLLVLAAVACSSTACTPRSTALTTAAPTSTHVATSRTGASSTPPNESPVPRPRECESEQLRLSVATSGSVMSQPYADIAVTNTGARPCVLHGYPTIVLSGRNATDDGSAVVALPIRVRHRLYERVDPGPRPLLVMPGHRAYFSLGTSDAYDGPLYAVTRLGVTLRGSTRENLTIGVDLLANAPAGQAIPVGLTALTSHALP